MSTDSSSFAPLASDTRWADTLDFADPQTSQVRREEAIRVLLTRRLNAVTHPSHEINQLHASQARGRECAKDLKGLIGRAPRVQGIIRGALREAFALDPDTVLFTERASGSPQKVDSLTERALALLVQPYVPININQFTTLSIKDDPTGRLPFTALQALERVKGLALLDRLDSAVRAYWQQLAHGSWLSRRERWVQLRQALFAENAWLAHRLYQLTDSGFAMVRQLMEIPGTAARKQAGGQWATLLVSRVVWPGTNQAQVPIPGALHIYREGDVEDTSHVIYLPGLVREFYEFSSWNQLQCDLPTLVNGPLSSVLWQCLPLRRWHELCNTASATPMAFSLQLIGTHQDDVLQASATELLDAQWDNELACALSINFAAVGIQAADTASAPTTKRYLAFIEKGRRRIVGFARLGRTLDTLLAWDHRRRSREIVGGSLAQGLAINTWAQQLGRYEKGLLALLDATDVANDSVAYQDFLKLERQWQEQVEAASKWAQGPQERVFQKTFWLEQLEGSRNRASLVGAAQHQALQHEAHMQQRLNLISPAHLERLKAALSKSWVPAKNATDTCVLQVTVGGEAATALPLLGAFVVTAHEAQAHPAHQHPVLFCVIGRLGGIVAFESLDAFAEGLRASLNSRDGSILWRCIERHQRESLRTIISRLPAGTPLGVSYAAIERHILKDLFLKLTQHYAAMDKRIDQGVRLFSEVSDPVLSRALLAQELFESLQVPANDARTLALANINLLQEAARQAKKLPSWLGIASTSQRRQYKRLSRRYLLNAWAVDSKLWQDLPELDAFARKALIAQLTKDGFYPQLDIDKPLFDMPDEVSSQYCGYTSGCVVGDRNIKMVVSPQRTTFSLLQLALHNLDPKAPWTRWRLNRARWLDPVWKERLSVPYLIKMISSLNVGGEYENQIWRAFYPPASIPARSSGLSEALVYRALKQRAQVHLYSGIRQGMSDKAQRLFTFAMAARAVGDLKADGFDAQLAVVRLVGVTLEHDRHITGVLLIHDKISGVCVLYWPMAVASRIMVGYNTFADAVEALNRLGALPENLKMLARQVAPGWESTALASYPGVSLQVDPRQPYSARPYLTGLQRFVAVIVEFFTVEHKEPAVALDTIEAQIKEQIALQPELWLEAVVTSHGHALALLAHARVLELQRRTRARSRSSATLDEYREQRFSDQHEASIRGLLSFVPVLGVGISVYEVLLAARRYHFSGSAHDAVDVAFLTILTFVDVLMTFAPGPKNARAAQVAIPRVHRYQSVAVALAGLKAAPAKPTQLLACFKASGALEGAIELKGPGGKGRYVKNGQQYIVDGDDAYPVYQHKNEGGLRLKNPKAEGSDELILRIEQAREWELGADSPVPGPSSGVLQPWAPIRGTSDWSPPSRAGMETALRASPAASDAFWQGWGFQWEQALTEVAPPRGIFQVPAVAGYPAYEVLKIGANYYRLLPQGTNALSPNLVFIMRNHDLGFRAYMDMDRWLGVGAAEQPMPTTLGANGRWTPHLALFDEPLEATVGRAFPGMTAGSRRFFGERLIELAGSDPTMTATHLLNIRATLDHWLAPGTQGRMVDLLKLLQPVGEPGGRSFNIGSEGLAPGAMRLDFTPPSRLNAALLRRRGNTIIRSQSAEAAVRQILERHGFTVNGIARRRGATAALDFYCTHPHTDTVYFVLTQWVDSNNVNLRSRVAPELSDPWFRNRISSSVPFSAEFAAIEIAMDENRLVRLVAGIQWPVRFAEPATVYFVKVMPASF
ncbi:dermonecrotic toxin domain-containing protein [Pseudomonas sp. O11]|uniref:dermonecrotic toxin domain-containing protein n=1 Tax=Pseudomonas sp. O11 TaxID=3159446 RepID=UPI00387A9031